MRIKLYVLFLGVFGIAATSGSAMDRWSALSMIESGNNDVVVGRSGEISRFQIQPDLWSGGNPQDAQIALSAARDLMRSRLAAFQHTHNRPATDFEFYILWNAPAEVDHPRAVVSDRAQRFLNLVRRG